MLSMLSTGASDDELDEVDNWLHKYIEQGKVDRVLECATIAIELLRVPSRPWPVAYAMNTLVVAYMQRGDIAKARMALSELINHSIEHNTPQAGLSGIDNVRKRMRGLAPADYLMHLMADMVRFYEHFGLIDDAISTILSVATFLGDYGAFQPAYHALADAERLARDFRDAMQLARVLETEASIALLEGDHEFGNKVAGMAADIYRELKVGLPNRLVLNQATSAMQSGKYEEALDGFLRFAQSHLADSTPHWLPTRINMSVCLRNLGDVDGADDQIRKARNDAIGMDDIDREQLVELELVAAANAKAGNRFPEVALCVSEAAKFLDQALSTADKLHYRRALRERYISRMESLLCSLPDKGAVGDVIEILACTRGNQLTDWLHLLDWGDEVSQLLDDEDRAKLNECIARLANFGAPYLQGYREKYNDPLAHGLMPDPWREFSEFAAELCKTHGFRHPLSASCLTNAANLISQRLREGFAFIASFLSTGKAILLIGESYHFCGVPVEETLAFGEKLHGHRQATTSRQEFDLVLRQYQAALHASFKALLPRLDTDACRGVIFLPDRWDLFPINLLMVGDEPVRARMVRGDFDVRTCVALYPRHAKHENLRTSLALVEEPSNLRLAKAQFESFCSLVGLNGRTIENAGSSDVVKSMSTIDALIMAQHGISIGLFVDPTFANTSGVGHEKDAVYFDAIQESAYRSSYRLVMLSACHSGTLVSRNAQREFKSHELAGYPSLLLTNRRCVVTGSAWATLDRFDYLLSTRFAIELKSGCDLARAFSIALAAIVDMPASEAMDLFDHLPDPDLRVQMNPGTSAEAQRVANLRRQPFCYGAYQVYTLV